MNKEKKQSMMEKMMEGLSAEDRQELMGSMMQGMMSQMFGGEGGMPSMMSGENSGENKVNPSAPVMKTDEDFRPWEFCPRRILCEKGFRKQVER